MVNVILFPYGIAMLIMLDVIIFKMAYVELMFLFTLAISYKTYVLAM